MSSPKSSEVVICGAGASGLGVANAILSGSPETKITIIDPDFEHSTNKTWCFWDKSLAPSTDLIHKSWKTISVYSTHGNFTEIFDHEIYFCILSKSYRNTLINKLRGINSVTLVSDTVSSINDKNDVETLNGETITASYVIDSRFKSVDDLVFHPKSNTLWQHFKGWVIETDADVFDQDHAILMDFRVPQDHGFAFVYFLPYSRSKALVELTYFNAEIPPIDFYDPILKDYLTQNWSLNFEIKSNSTHYKVIETEYGVIPMTDLPIQIKSNDSYVKTGLSGGLAKASTGYAFSRGQRHASMIAKSIAMKLPLQSWQSPVRFQYYDMLILNLLRHHPDHVVDIFMSLFSKNGFKLVFDFLDEKTSFAEELKIMSSVPSYTAFFNSIWETRNKAGELVYYST